MVAKKIVPVKKDKKTEQTEQMVKKTEMTNVEIVEKKKTPEINLDLFPDCEVRNGRIFLKKMKNFAGFPDLLELQKKGYSTFIEKYLPKLFESINPVWDIAGEKMYIGIDDIKVSEPIDDVKTCKKKELTYGGIVTGKVKLVDSVNKKTLFTKRANIGILPLMTNSASYIINGVEKVIISQIIRSYGIFYTQKDFKYGFKVIPENGPWLEVNVEKSGAVVARINKSRKFPVTALLRVFGAETDDMIRAYFKDYFDDEDFNFLEATLKKDTTTDALSAAEHIYNKVRPGELIDSANALDYIKNQFLSEERIFVGRIARRKINAKLGLKK